MQHRPGSEFHRSTLWRRRKAAEKRKKLSWVEHAKAFDENKRPSGRRRADPGEENQILGFAAGIVDRLNERGVFSPAELSVPVFGPHKPGHESRMDLIHGTTETVNELRASGLPPRLLLYAVGLIYLGFYPEKLGGEASKEIQGFGAYYQRSGRLEKAARRQSLRSGRRVGPGEVASVAEKESRAVVGRSDSVQTRGIDNETGVELSGGMGEADEPYLRNPSLVYKVPGFRRFISRTAIYYWDEHKKLRSGLSLVHGLIDWDSLRDRGKMPSGELDLAHGLYALPELEKQLNAP